MNKHDFYIPDDDEYVCLEDYEQNEFSEDWYKRQFLEDWLDYNDYARGETY